MKKKISLVLLIFLMMTMIIPMKSVLASVENIKLQENEERVREYNIKFFIDKKYGEVDRVSTRYKKQTQVDQDIKYGYIDSSINKVDKSNGTEISVIIDRHDFKKSDKYIFLIYTDKYLFPVYLDDLLKKKEDVIDVVPNREYAFLPKVEIENAHGFNYQKINWSMVNDEGFNLGLQIEYSSLLYNNIKVPCGKYSLSLIGDDDKNYYSLFKSDIDINNNTDTIKFTRNELYQVNLKVNNTTTSCGITIPDIDVTTGSSIAFQTNDTTTSTALKIKSFMTVANDLSEAFYSEHENYSKPDIIYYRDLANIPDYVERIYTTRNVNADSIIEIEFEEGWKYCYRTSKLEFNGEEAEINLSTEFSLNSYIAKRIEDNSGDIQVVNEIVDSYGNKVPLITSSDGEMVETTIEVHYQPVETTIEPEGEIVAISNWHIINKDTIILSIMDYTGECFIISKIKESQIPIKEIAKKIILEDGYVVEIDGEPQLSDNAKLKSIKINDVEIKGFWWSISTYTTSFNPNETLEITAEAMDPNAKIDIIYPTEENNCAIINAVSESGLNSRIYKINFEKVLSVTLDVTDTTLIEGEALQLNATIEPSYAENKKLFWSSSKPDIASVDDNGLVIAKKKGWVRIKVITEEGNKLDYCRIKVEEPQDIEKESYQIKFSIGKDIGRVIDAKVYCKSPILVNGKIEYKVIPIETRELYKNNEVELSILIDKDKYIEADKYVFLISTDKYLFPVYLSELTNNKEIKLVPNEKYNLFPKIKLEGIKSNYFRQGSSYLYIITDENIPLPVKVLYESFRYNKFKVPFGKYSLQVNGTCYGNYYVLLKTDIEITENTNIIEFNNDELCQVNIRMDNEVISTPVKVNYDMFSGYGTLEELYNFRVYHLNEKNYTTRNIKTNLNIEMQLKEDWTIEYTVNEIDFNREVVDIDLSSELSISPSILKTGKIANLVRDSYGNSVICRRYENDVYFKDSIEVRNMNNELVDVPKDKENSNMWDIQGLNGEYYVTSRVEDFVMPIKEITKKILVKNGKVLEIDGVPQYNEENKNTDNTSSSGSVSGGGGGSSSGSSNVSITKTPHKIDLKEYEKKVEKKYVNHERLKSLEEVSRDKEFKVRVNKALYNDKNQKEIAIERIKECFKLIDMDDKEEKEFLVSIEDDKTIKLKPKFKLKKGHVYLLVIDKSFSVNGNELSKGSTCVITVK